MNRDAIADLSREDLQSLVTRLQARVDALEAERQAGIGMDGLVHELRADQVELELQNEALRDAQGELEESRSQFEELYDWAPVAYVTFDPAGRIVRINLAGAAVFGLERSFLIQKPFITLARFEDATTFWTHLRACVEGRKNATHELRFTTARGVQDVQAQSSPVFGLDGNVRQVRTVLTDCRAMKRVERDLERARVAERTLRERVEHVSSAFIEISAAVRTGGADDVRNLLQVIVDAARRIVGAEYAALGVGGHEDEPFHPWVYSGLTPDEAAAIGRAPRPVGMLGRSREAERPHRFRTLRRLPWFGGLPERHPDITSYLSAPIADESGSVATIYLANKVDAPEFTDADELTIGMLAQRAAVAIRIAHALGKERRRMQLFAAVSQAIASSMNLESLLALMTDAAVPALGEAAALYLLGEDGGLEVRAVHSPRGFGAVAIDSMTAVTLADDVRRALLEAGRSLSFGKAPETLRRLGDGPTLLLPIRSGDRVCGVLQTVRKRPDGRYQAEDEALGMEFADRIGIAVESVRLHEMGRRMAIARDEMLSLATHDMRNLLNTISVGAQVLSLPGPNGERRASGKQVDAIRRAAARMSTLIGSLRDLGDVEGIRNRASIAPEPAEPLIEEAILALSPRADAKSVSVSFQTAASPREILCDRERIKQALVNLLAHAIAVTPPHGCVTVRIDATSTELVVSITDGGPSPSPLEQTRGFDREPDRGDTESRLGLYVTREIVRNHRGRIWAENDASAGPTIRIALPSAAGSRRTSGNEQTPETEPETSDSCFGNAGDFEKTESQAS